MDYLRIVILSIVSLIVLFLLTKLIGNKEMSQLNMFDYITGITIGSIAAELATSLDKNFWHPLIAMVIYGIAAFSISYAANKSLPFRRVMNGKAIILMESGKIYKKNLGRARLDLNEFLTQCRILGYFNPAEIDTAIFESTGKISIIPKVGDRPAKTKDFNLNPPPSQDKITYNVIIDGKVLERNLKYTGHDFVWLKQKLQEKNTPNLKDVFLATCDNQNNVEVYIKTNEKPKNDPFL